MNANELNIVSASTYEFLNRAYDKLMDKNAHLVEENDIQRSSIQTLSKQVADLQTLLNETYIDDNGIVWGRPTAWAYYAVCKARDKWQKKAEGLEKIILNMVV
jgi:hypothetical protein